MEEDIIFKEELVSKLKYIENPEDRIELLEDFLKEKEKISIGLLAYVYEKLGEAYLSLRKEKGSFFQKAGSSWETAAMLKNDFEKREEHLRHKFLKRALKNYNIAIKIYKKQNFKTGIEEVKYRKQFVKNELRQYGGKFRAIGIIIVMVSFLVSFIFISSSFTGFVLSPMSATETTYTGIVLTVLAILGGIIVLKIWK